MFNPWPCTTLQRGVQILAIIDGVCSLMRLVLHVRVYFLVASMKPNSQFPKMSLGLITVCILNIYQIRLRQKCKIFVYFGPLTSYSNYIALAVFLFFGASRRKYAQCRIWLIVTGILTILLTISLLVFIFAIEPEERRRGNAWHICVCVFVGIGAGCLFIAYEMLVVYVFLQESKPQGAIVEQLGDGLPTSGDMSPAPDQIDPVENLAASNSLSESIADNPITP